MKAIVISLASETERRDYVKNQLDKLQIETHTIAAVDGRSLGANEIERMVSPRLMQMHREFATTWASVNAIACAASHRKAYEYIAGHPSYRGPWLILEDDADLHSGLDVILKNCMHTMSQENLDIVLFYFSVVQDLRLEAYSAIRVAGGRKLYKWEGSPPVASTVGYLLSCSAAQKLLDCQTPLSCPADEWLHFYEQKALSRIRLIYPFAVTTGLFDSTIGSAKKISSRRRLMLLVSGLRKYPMIRRLFLFLRKWDWSGNIKVIK